GSRAGGSGAERARTAPAGSAATATRTARRRKQPGAGSGRGIDLIARSLIGPLAPLSRMSPIASSNR
ncbi:MAG TPA: hypothetical protein VE400_15390, partial [Mycobacterium sp.]|nr:hypothetical protein [Mycobacterium sp.]